MSRLAGKVALVTGAGSGIGRESTLLFAQNGASLFAVDRSRQAVAETVRTIRDAGGQAAAAVLDAGSDADMRRAAAEAAAAFGGLDIVFANAGILGEEVPLEAQTVELWDTVLRVNLIGPFLAIKHCAPYLLKGGGGSIICTASVAGLKAGAGSHPYSASKAGVISLVQTAAQSFAGTGVRVNAICPGLIDTGMTQHIFDSARRKGVEDRLGQLAPLRRPGLPREVAAAALFLASAESSYVNGQAIPVDGGLSSSLPFALRREAGGPPAA